MKFVALLSGGKDSVYNVLLSIRNGHELVVVGNLYPKDTQIGNLSRQVILKLIHFLEEELDSYCFQTVGHRLIDSICECMDVTLIKRAFEGKRNQEGIDYKTPENGINEKGEAEEVEVLYDLLREITEKYPEVEAVATGAILSNYQRNRILNVCGRLKLKSLNFLWEREQKDLLSDMIKDNMDAILIKTACFGLDPKKHCGKSIKELESHFHDLNKQFSMNVCGEGGEYETLVLDCELYKKKIVIDEAKVEVGSDEITGHYIIEKFHIEEKKKN